FELHNKVQIAPLRVEIDAHRRAEKLEPPYMKAAADQLQFVAAPRDFVNHRGRPWMPTPQPAPGGGRDAAGSRRSTAWSIFPGRRSATGGGAGLRNRPGPSPDPG